jgi:hypothetical protein
MKIKRNAMGWFIAIFVVGPIVVFLLNQLLFSANYGTEKQVPKYIENSIELDLQVPNHLEFEIGSIRTGIRQVGSRTGLRSKQCNRIIFFSSEYGKYFSIILAGSKKATLVQFTAFANTVGDHLIVAKVNKSDMGNPDYGTEENPVPIFMFSIPKLEGRKSYERFAITEEQYKNAVYYYLAYMMPKKEFKTRFENGKEYDFKHSNGLK